MMRFELPTDKSHAVQVVVFRAVQNSAQVVDKMKEGAVKAALLNARLVPSLFPLLVASSTALRRYDDGDNLTRSVATEIVYHLSPTRNISHSLKTMGITPETRDIVAVLPDGGSEDLADLRALVVGQEESGTDACLSTLCDEAHVRAVYGIAREETDTSSLEDSVVTRMACRDVK